MICKIVVLLKTANEKSVLHAWLNNFCYISVALFHPNMIDICTHHRDIIQKWLMNKYNVFLLFMIHCHAFPSNVVWSIQNMVITLILSFFLQNIRAALLVLVLGNHFMFSVQCRPHESHWSMAAGLVKSLHMHQWLNMHCSLLPTRWRTWRTIHASLQLQHNLHSNGFYLHCVVCTVLFHSLFILAQCS